MIQQDIRFRNSTAVGLLAGFAAGVSYGLNPLFGKPLLEAGVPVSTMLFFRYFISALILGAWMLARKEPLKIKARELRLLMLLGVLFACSSITLFESYKFIPSGLATTLVYLYPIFVSLIMIALRKYPTWQSWLSIAATTVGVVLLCLPQGSIKLHTGGMILAALSALSYALYLVIVNVSDRIRHISEHTLTFYALLTGSVLFLFTSIPEKAPFLTGCNSWASAMNLFGLAIFPTMISMLTLALSTRIIGPVRTAVLGVFEPITSILIGTLLFKEVITSRMLLGIGICIAALMFMVITTSRRKQQ
ncbi:MAG: DMT family transporter [Bacteroidales bacterium]|nr:DMT family transporter [Bacteroidales bacterium]